MSGGAAAHKRMRPVNRKLSFFQVARPISNYRLNIKAVSLTALLVALVYAWPFSLKAQAQLRGGGAQNQTKGTQQKRGVAQIVHDAAALMQAGKLAEAEIAVRSAISADPRDAEAHALLGVILDQQGHAEEAERELRESLRLNPKSAGALTNLGVILVRAQRTDEAIKTFEEALKI